jgi:lysozyme
MGKYKNYIIALAIVGLILISSKVSAAKIIANFENIRLKAYKDSAGIWTIGYGSTYNPETGTRIKEGDVITKETALRWLNLVTASTQNSVKNLVKRPINDRQLAALTSLAYNIGVGAFSRSTLLRKLNAGANDQEVAAHFADFNKVTTPKGKVVSRGLIRRRKEEAELYLS